MATPELVADTRNQLGECPVWDEHNQCLWWTDIQSSRLYRLAADQSVQQWTTPERLCSFGLLPKNGLIAAFESGFALYYPQHDSVHWLDKIEAELKYTRMNDGRCDRFGRFFAGTMVEHEVNEHDVAGSEADQPPLGSLYRLNGDGVVAAVASDIQISNSLCWSPDNKILYFADSAQQTIWAYDYHSDSGTINNRRIFATTQGQCFPDGSAVDSEGYLWNAQWGASQVVRYRPDGSIDQQITLPVSQPSCVAFGGADLKTLYVTSARDGLSAQVLSQQTLAGSLFSIRCSVAGITEGRFKPRQKLFQR